MHEVASISTKQALQVTTLDEVDLHLVAQRDEAQIVGRLGAVARQARRIDTAERHRRRLPQAELASSPVFGEGMLQMRSTL